MSLMPLGKEGYYNQQQGCFSSTKIIGLYFNHENSTICLNIFSFFLHS
ncbi:MAG: Unknown protein [uncultured Aureispira sp.]|uniref:Uncharacterized protein n=1 Tax=uncultured Aureispira sp. TaxID=1331704 RepID=A0A6S6S5E3_9BACT|nr:MAG: Unknown protein [uncultured Aureispira sp.]